MKKLAMIAAFSTSAFALSTNASFADYELNILHINDWHSRIESNNAFESTCSAEEETEDKCIGGAARLVTAVRQRREALTGQNTLLLNGGDNFQGSLFYTTYKGKAEGEFLNLMKFDAMTVGNHEFDDGEDALVPFLEMVEFPVLSANVSATAASKVGDMIKPSIVLDVGGQKIGIVGAVTNDTPEVASPGPNITIEDDVARITAEVEKLTAEGVNKIIALTHVGYVRDMELIAKIPNVDVVVGGHSHSLLSNTDDKAEGPYPTMVENPGGYRVPVTQAASYSKYLGEFKVVFDDNGVVKSAAGDPLYLDSAIEPDAAVLARVAEMGAPIEELKNKEVSETTEAIDGSRETCRAVECAMGNLITDAMLDRMAGQGVTIAIQNGGGIRASIDAGTVTMGEVLTVLPFQNTLATFQITGADLTASLEAGLSEIEEGKGKFPQVGGMRYAFDKSVAPNEGRLKSAEVMEGGNWVPIDPAKLYTVATNNFVRGGGDGYKLFAEKAQNAYDFGPGLEQVVADYLTANRPYTPKVEGRITEVAAAAPAEPPVAEAPAATPPVTEPTPPVAEAPATPPVATTPPVAETPAASPPAATTPPVAEAPANPPATEPTPPVAEAPAIPPAGSENVVVPPVAGLPEAPPADLTPPADVAAAPPAAAEATPPASATPPADATYVIKSGDSYWEIAEEIYGDPLKWTMLAEANPDVSAGSLPVGATLVVPPAN